MSMAKLPRNTAELDFSLLLPHSGIYPMVELFYRHKMSKSFYIQFYTFLKATFWQRIKVSYQYFFFPRPL